MKLYTKKLQIACDGGAATGKSTGSKMLAKKYKIPMLSSGLLYRYAGYLLIKNNPENKIAFLKKKFNKLEYKKLNKLNLHSPKISENAAKIAKILAIRNILKKYQQNFIRRNKNCILEGRDASTKIMPESNVKFFFTCSLSIAARRRFNELKKYSKKIKYSEVKKAMIIRNKQDRTRKFSPLQRHPSSIIVDSGKYNTKELMLKKMVKHIEKVLSK